MAKPPEAKTKDQGTKREDEILRRMLSTPPKPHKPIKKKPKRPTKR